jgi:hypothetical protein
VGCSAHLLHRVAIAIVGGFLVLLFFLRFVRSFAFLTHLVSSVALLALVTVPVFLLYVHFYLALALLFRSPPPPLYFRLFLGVGAMESASDSLSGSTETSEWMIFLGIGRG